MSRHTITLKFPFDFGGVTVTELSLRRPKVRDIRAMEKGKGSDSDRSITMMANLAEVDPDLFDELDPVDFAAVNDWLEPILDPKGQRGASKN